MSLQIIHLAIVVFTGFANAIYSCSAVVGVKKPDPAIWRLGIKAAGREAAECIAIGDSFDKDIAAAQAAGCRTIWFKGQEWTPAKHHEAQPGQTVTALTQLLDILQ